MGFSSFYMGKEGELMFWGGEFQRTVIVVQQRRAVQLNARTLTVRDDRLSLATKDLPVLEFRLVAGAPMRSRCQWARVVVHGSGPLKRFLQQRSLLNTLSPFDQAQRWFLSLDEFGLHFFENKYDTKALCAIAIRDFVAVYTDMNGPSILNESKGLVEDICNVRLLSALGDDIFFRFADSGSRSAWVDALLQAMHHAKKSTEADSRQSRAHSWMPASWLAPITTDDVATTASSGTKPARSAADKVTKPLSVLAEEGDDDDDDSDDSSASSISS